MEKRVLITGAKGQAGTELVKTAPSSWEVIALTRQELDICQPERTEKSIREIAPHVIINTAAYTPVDKAEEEPRKAFEVNARGAALLAEIAVRHHARIIHISSDFVFDGRQSHPYRPEDTPVPLNIYGKSKWEGEKKIKEIAEGQAVILRTSWLYSSHGNNFVKTILKLIQEKETLKVVDDQVGSPTWARGLAETLWKIVGKPSLKGTYHWSDAGVASWYDFAIAIQEEAYALKLISQTIPIYPICSSEYKLKAKRPSYSVLDKTETWKELNITPKHWRKALRECLREIKEL